MRFKKVDTQRQQRWSTAMLLCLYTGSSAPESNTHRCSGAERRRQRSDRRQRRLRDHLSARKTTWSSGATPHSALQIIPAAHRPATDVGALSPDVVVERRPRRKRPVHWACPGSTSGHVQLPRQWQHDSTNRQWNVTAAAASFRCRRLRRRSAEPSRQCVPDKFVVRRIPDEARQHRSERWHNDRLLFVAVAVPARPHGDVGFGTDGRPRRSSLSIVQSVDVRAASGSAGRRVSPVSGVGLGAVDGLWRPWSGRRQSADTRARAGALWRPAAGPDRQVEDRWSDRSRTGSEPRIAGWHHGVPTAPPLRDMEAGLPSALRWTSQ